MFISENLYKQIISSIPILCVDIIIKNEQDQILLVKRNNEPVKDRYWVVGGRVNIGEKAKDAAKRKLLSEVGIKSNRIDFIGIYEGLFDINPFEKMGDKYHTLGLVFETEVHSSTDIELDDQSSDWKWSKSLPERYKIIKN